MICPNCQRENRTGAKFCDECGFPLTGKIAEVTKSLEDFEAEGVNNASSTLELPVIEVEDDADESVASLEHLPHVNDKSEAQAHNEEEVDASPVDTDDTNKGDSSLTDLPRIQTDETSRDIKASAPDALEAFDQEDESSSSADKTAVIETKNTTRLPEPDITADLSGLDTAVFGETIVNEKYASFSSNARSGDTMKMPRIEDDEQPSSKNFLATATAESNAPATKTTKTVIIVAILLALVATGVGVAYYFNLWGGKPVPDVVGMTEGEARLVLQEEGFTVRSMQIKSDGTQGLVLVEDPNAGSRLAEGTEVVIHVATARLVPSIEGLTQDEAEQLFANEGLTNVTYELEKSNEAEGTVLSVDPEPGTTLLAADAITVKIADPYKVPDVSKLGPADAEAAVNDAGFVAEINYVENPDYPEGTILATHPEADTVLQSGSSVVIDISINRAAQLTDASNAAFAPGATFIYNGANFEVSSLDSVEYIGNDQTSITVTASPFAVLFGERIYAKSRSVSGTATWDANNNLISFD